MAKALALVLLLAVPAVFGAATINFAGTVSANGIRLEADKNVTVRNTNADYSFRSTSMATFDIGFFKFGTATSVSLNANHDAGSGSGSANGEFCMAFFGGTVMAQTVASQKASWTSGGGTASFSFSGAASTVVSVYESIQEINSAGDIVKDVALDTLTAVLSTAKKSTITTQAGGTASVHYATLNSTVTSAPISLTFVLSDVLGVLNIGGATVTPKSIETIVEVLGWPLQNPANHLRLNIIAATATVSNAGSGTITADHALIVGEGPTQAYFRAASHASVDGTITAVSVRTETGVEGDISGTSSFVTGALQASNDFSGKFSVARVTVDMPAGANTFTYDPAAGFEAPDSASRALPLLAFLVAAVMAFRNLA